MTTAWVDIGYYLNEYLLGKIPTVPASDFSHYAVRATATVKRYTGVNISDDKIPEEAKYAVCAVCELLYGYDKASSGIGVTSEKTGDLSITYASASEKERELSTAVRNAVYSYLADGGYLYCGVVGC